MMYCDLGSLMQKNGLGTKLPIHETKNWKFHENTSHKNENGTLGNVIFQSLKFNYWQRAMKYAQNL